MELDKRPPTSLDAARRWLQSCLAPYDSAPLEIQRKSRILLLLIGLTITGLFVSGIGTNLLLGGNLPTALLEIAIGLALGIPLRFLLKGDYALASNTTIVLIFTGLTAAGMLGFSGDPVLDFALLSLNLVPVIFAACLVGQRWHQMVIATALCLCANLAYFFFCLGSAGGAHPSVAAVGVLVNNTLIALITGGLALVLTDLNRKLVQRAEDEARHVRGKSLEIQKAEERLRVTLRSIGDGVIATDTEGRVVLMNPVAETLSGWTQAAAAGQPLGEVCRIVHEKTGEPLTSLAEAAVHEGGVVALMSQSALVARDGTRRSIAANGAPIRDMAGNIAGSVQVFRDVTKHRQAEERIRKLNRVYAVLSHINQVIVRVREPNAVFEQACRIAVDKGRFRLAWVGLANESPGRLRMVASAGISGEALRAPSHPLNGQHAGDCLLDQVLRTGRPAVCNGLELCEQPAQRQLSALELGLRSSASFPLTVAGTIRGAWSLYSDDPDSFDADEIRLLSDLAMNLSFVMEFAEREANHRAADAALRESEERFRTLYENSTVGIYRTTPEGRILLANPALVSILGYSSFDELSSRDLNQAGFEPSYERTRFLEAIEREGEVRGLETIWTRQDGTPLFVRESARRIRDAEGKTLYYDGIVEDISERKRAVTALRGSEARFRSLIENASDIVMLLSAKGTFQYASPSLERMLGYRPEELVGRSSLDILHAEDPSDIGRLLEQLGRSAGSTATVQCHARHKDGRVRILEATLRNLLDDPAVVGIVVNSRDITERTRAEEEREKLRGQLLHSQKMEAVGLLAGGVAHDFNNLLTTILGLCEVLLRDLPENDPKYLDLREIEKAGERAAGLTAQLLAFGRKQILQPKVLDLNRVVEDMGKMLRRLIGEHIVLVEASAAGLGRIKADPGQTEQIIMNLVVNARDAMQDGGTLTIETADVDLENAPSSEHLGVPPGRYVMLAVKDTGHGMDDETRVRIFEPFFTTKAPGKGTGLGLSTVYGIVKQSGGHIDVRSKPGQGSVFRIYLPRQEEASGVLPGLNFRAQARGGSETVLVVEDEASVRRMVRLVLEKQGYSVLEASGGAEGLAISKSYREPIHLLVTDVVMPGMSGPEMVRRMALSRPGVKVLYMSGHADDEIFRHGLLDSGKFFLAKPFVVNALADKVREALDVDSD